MSIAYRIRNSAAFMPSPADLGWSEDALSQWRFPGQEAEINHKVLLKDLAVIQSGYVEFCTASPIDDDLVGT